MGLANPVIELRIDWPSGEKRLYESVNVPGAANRADFVRQCILIACRTGRFSFSYFPACTVGIIWRSNSEQP